MSQVFDTNSLGGYFSVPKLSSKLRTDAQPLSKFRSFARLETDFSANASNSIYFDKVTNVQTAGDELTEGSVIPKTNFRIVQESCVVNEIGKLVAA